MRRKNFVSTEDVRKHRKSSFLCVFDLQTEGNDVCQHAIDILIQQRAVRHTHHSGKKKRFSQCYLHVEDFPLKSFRVSKNIMSSSSLFPQLHFHLPLSTIGIDLTLINSDCIRHVLEEHHE